MLFESDHLFLLFKTSISVSMALLMIAALTDFKYSKRTVLTAYGIYVVYALLSSWAVILFWGWMTLLNVFILTLVLPAVILTYCVAKDHSMQAVFNYMTQINIFLIISATVTLLNTALHGNKVTDLTGRFLLLGAMAFVEYRFLRRPFRKIADSLDRNWLPLALIPMTFLVLILLCALFPVNYTKNPWGVIQLYTVAIVMAVVYYVVFRSLLKSYRLLEVKLEKDVMNAQLYAQKQYYRTTLRREHEVSEKSFALEALLRENRAGAAVSLLEEWNVKRSNLLYCPNPYINAAVELFVTRFEELNIPFYFDFQLGTALLHDAEVFLILNNALENAMEASLRLPEEDRLVKVQSQVVQEQFLIRVRNRFDGKLLRSNDLPHSTKQSPGHGYGLSSIRAAAERTGGDMSFRVENDSFVLDVRTQTATLDHANADSGGLTTQSRTAAT